MSANPRALLAEYHFGGDSEIEDSSPDWELFGTWTYELESSTNRAYTQSSLSGGARAITGISTDDEVVQARIKPLTFAGGQNWFGLATRYRDVAGIVYRELISGHPDFAGDVPDYQTLPKGAGTAAPHLSWTGEPYVTGEACKLELGANRNRYNVPLARTLHLGKPPERLTRLAATVGEEFEAALSAVKPGHTCEDIEAAWRRATAASGLVKKTRIGYPPDWGERTASLMPEDRTVFEPNMTFHLMLGIWELAGGYEISETFRVTQKGHACFSSLPRGLVVRHA